MRLLPSDSPSSSPRPFGHHNRNSESISSIAPLNPSSNAMPTQPSSTSSSLGAYPQANERSQQQSVITRTGSGETSSSGSVNGQARLLGGEEGGVQRGELGGNYGPYAVSKKPSWGFEAWRCLATDTRIKCPSPRNTSLHSTKALHYPPHILKSLSSQGKARKSHWSHMSTASPPTSPKHHTTHISNPPRSVLLLQAAAAAVVRKIPRQCQRTNGRRYKATPPCYCGIIKRTWTTRFTLPTLKVAIVTSSISFQDVVGSTS